MKRQKICIIGGSLTGLLTAIGLSKLNCDIDLILGNAKNNTRSNGTVAISESNIDFINNLKICKFLKKQAWPCSVMKLYTENKDQKLSEIFELNNNRKEKKIMYMLENSKIIKLMKNKIKKTKSISIIRNELIYKIGNLGLLKSVKIKNNYHKYNLIIICTGNNSDLVKNHFNDQIIKSSYKEISVTTILKHNLFKNNTVRQFFLKSGILAFLPISNTKTSIVFSIKKKINDNKLIIKRKILCYAKNYFKNITFVNNIKYTDLNFSIRNKYYKDRTLLFGDALHTIHPFVGQGFNMTIRDLSCLIKILRKKISLGLDIGSLDVLLEFSSEAKPRNFVFSVGSDLLKNSFYSNKLRDGILKILNKNNLVKNIFFNIADKGFEF